MQEREPAWILQHSMEFFDRQTDALHRCQIVCKSKVGVSVNLGAAVISDFLFG